MTFKIISTFYGHDYGTLVKAYPVLSAEFNARNVESHTTHIFISTLAELMYLLERLKQDNDKRMPCRRIENLVVNEGVIEIYDGYRE